MSDRIFYQLAADALLLLHFLFVCFVVLGLLLIFIGKWRGWRWIRNFWFRVAHLLAIAVVAAQSWFGMICPLTVWEMELRERGGGQVYTGAFIAHWIEQLLYYRAPNWVFALVYTGFGVLVLASWFLVRPNKR